MFTSTAGFDASVVRVPRLMEGRARGNPALDPRMRLEFPTEQGETDDAAIVLGDKTFEPPIGSEAAIQQERSIGARVGGVFDAIADGQTGLLVPVHQPHLLADAIGRLRDDQALRHRLGDAARLRAHADFTEDSMVASYAEIFGASGRKAR